MDEFKFTQLRHISNCTIPPSHTTIIQHTARIKRPELSSWLRIWWMEGCFLCQWANVWHQKSQQTMAPGWNWGHHLFLYNLWAKGDFTFSSGWKKIKRRIFYNVRIMWKSHFSAINKVLLICRHSHSLYTLYTAAFTKLPTKNWHLSFASIIMKSFSHCGHWPSDTLKGVQGGDQEWGYPCSGKKLAELASR